MKVSTVFALVPVAVIATIVAIANRQDVTFKLNPFSDGGPDAVVMPLFLLVFLTFLAGVVVGGTTIAVRSGLKARRKRSEASRLTVVRNIEQPKP
jgi:uncharacterized integral membrane protein